jgi:hypothetical protein
MTMLEDDLREMFSARAQAPLAPIDPAGSAIASGRVRRLRRRLLVSGIAACTLASMVGGLVVMKGFWAHDRPGGGNEYSFEALYGPGSASEATQKKSMDVIAMPIDIHQGTALWTADGRRLVLPGVEQVIEVIRVPAGWLYSDDFQLRLLTTGGQPVSLRENVSAWTVSDDGASVAGVSADSTLAVLPSTGGDAKVTAMPAGWQPSGFDGARVVLSREGYGSDSWEPGEAVYVEQGQPELVAVYTAGSKQAVGIVLVGSKTCLVDLVARTKGWIVSTSLGCADLLNNAVQAGQGAGRAARSPDGRWLAVPSPTGVHLVDIEASRLALERSLTLDGLLVFAYSCVSSPGAPAVWSDAATVLTVTNTNGVVACKIDGSRYSVALPEGVSDGWDLVRRYGVTS